MAALREGCAVPLLSILFARTPLDVKVLDHFIVAGTGTMSFAERGLVSLRSRKNLEL